LTCAGLAGLIGGAVVALPYAVGIHILSGLALDSTPKPMSAADMMMLYLRVVGLGAGAGAAGFAVLTGIVLVCWKSVRMAYAAVRSAKRKVDGGKSAKTVDPTRVVGV
jgi:hypothetical protein